MIYFDASLPEFASLLISEAGPKILDRGVFFRDASGRLTFLVEHDALSDEQREVLSKKAADRLVPYVDRDGLSVSTPAESFFPDDVIVTGRSELVSVGGSMVEVRLIDQRVAGGDWLNRPAPLSRSKRMVFASLKGGVGRSTALCVAAAAMAQVGMRVLAIDMDVEAPGLGSMLLSAETAPEFGLLDYLVETNVGDPDDAFMVALTAPSWLSRGHGVIDVLPAIGKSSFANKKNVLSKMARAYLDVGSGEGGTLTDRMQSLLGYFEQRNEYDVILIDARAGLHETTGSAILGLGGQVLLFGTDQPQTFAAYELLMANLRLVEPLAWENRILAVQAKAKADADSISFFAEKFGQILGDGEEQPSQSISENDLNAMRGVFDVDWDDSAEVEDQIEDALLDEGAGFEFTYILESETFRDFDPLSRPENLMEAAYDTVYGAFLAALFRRLAMSYGDTLDG